MNEKRGNNFTLPPPWNDDELSSGKGRGYFPGREFV